MKRFLLLLTLASLLPLSSEAKVRLPHVMGDNMVLQQNADVRLWGWADAGKHVRVTVSWNKERYACTADSAGRWQVFVHTPAASYEPLSITFNDGDKLTLSNVLAGEVWACGGQSNMEMPMRGFGNCPTEGFTDEVINAPKYSGVRFFFAESARSFEPQDDVKGQWKVTSPETVGDCSATAYFFGQTLNRVLGVPIGLVIACKGGTPVECWLNKDNLKAHTNVITDSAAIVKRWKKVTWHYPYVWYNATLRPIENYTVKGMIFYQGCSNLNFQPDKYPERLALFVQQCRKEFANADMPFHYVQIAPYIEGTADGTRKSYMREQQMKALPLISNATITCTQDLVYPWEGNQVHPAQKKQVGQRLALQALNKQYGYENIRCESPKFKSMTIKGKVCLLDFTDTYGGFNRLNDLEGFEVAGEDRVFHKAQGKTKSGHEIEVWSDEVEKPVAVRYCFRNFQLGNVANQAYLPLFPFRTDDWPLGK